MKNQAVTGNRLNTSQPAAPEPAVKNTPLPSASASGPASNHKHLHGAQLQQGGARAAGLRQTLEQNAAGVEAKAPAAAGTVIKYASEQRAGRRQRAEPGEDVMPLDEEIHHLNGSRRLVQLDRKAVLEQRARAKNGFKNVRPERTEHTDDLVTEGWEEDH